MALFPEHPEIKPQIKFVPGQSFSGHFEVQDLPGTAGRITASIPSHMVIKAAGGMEALKPLTENQRAVSLARAFVLMALTLRYVGIEVPLYVSPDN